MDSEDGGGTSPTELTYQSRVRAESLREAEPITSKGHEEQMNLQHALILNQVGSQSILSHKPHTHTQRESEREKAGTVDRCNKMYTHS